MNIFYRKTISILLLALYFSLLYSNEKAHDIQDEFPKGFASEYLNSYPAAIYAVSASFTAVPGIKSNINLEE